MDKTASSPYLNQKPRTEAQARADIGERMAREERDRILREHGCQFLRQILEPLPADSDEAS